MLIIYSYCNTVVLCDCVGFPPAVYFSLLIKSLMECNNEVCQLFIDFEKAYDFIKRESLYDILIKFGVIRKLN